MTHPLVPQILDLATPVANSLDLELVGAVFHTNFHPPVLRVDIRNQQSDTGLDDCERMSRALEVALDEAGIIPDTYVLEVSSPGVSNVLNHDRDFVSFKGFTVMVMADQPYGGQQQWVGKLNRRDEAAVYLSLKGRTIAIPRNIVTKVQLVEGQE